MLKSGPGSEVDMVAHDSGLDGTKEEVSSVLTVTKDEKCVPAEQAKAKVDISSTPVPQEDASRINGDKNGKDTSLVLVYATAALSNCPHSTVDDMTLSAISEILNSKDHLRNNMYSIEFCNIRNRPMYRGSIQYMHEVEISLKVMKNRLWKSARSYLWKNIGTSSWTLLDGTQVSFIKIHQK